MSGVPLFDSGRVGGVGVDGIFCFILLLRLQFVCLYPRKIVLFVTLYIVSCDTVVRARGNTAKLCTSNSVYDTPVHFSSIRTSVCGYKHWKG